MKRRPFLSRAALTAAGATAGAPQPRIQWRMATGWTPALDVLQGGAQRVARMVESEKSPMAKKVHASYVRFEPLVTDWGRASEAPYHEAVAG